MRTIWVYKGTPNPPVKPSAVQTWRTLFNPSRTRVGDKVVMCAPPILTGERLKFLPFLVIAVLIASVGSALYAPVASTSLSAKAARPVAAFGHSGPVPQTAWTVFDVWWDFGSNDILYDTSGDGGTTWGTDVRINDRGGSASGSGWQIPLPAVAVDRSTWTIYVSWMDDRNGNFDIYASASTDVGRARHFYCPA